MNYLVLFICAFAGGLAVFQFRTQNTRNLKLVLSFSGAYLFAITVLHLIPEVYHSGNPYTGVYVLLGFAIQILLEQFSEGVEHGHIHLHSGAVGKIPLGIMISLCLHAFMEGIPLANNHNSPLLYGIALHHIPASFALGSILIHNKISKGLMLFLLFSFAIMSPLGIIAGNSLGSFALNYDYLMAIVIGIFLHISTTILFEVSVDHRFNLYKIIAIALGAGIALMNFFIF